MDIINILKKINLQGKFSKGMIIDAGNLLSAIGRGAFVNSSAELYSQLKDISKDVDKDRVFNKLFLGGAFGAFGNIAGNAGKKIKVGNGDLQTAAEVGVNFLTTTGQAIADSVESKKEKTKKQINNEEELDCIFWVNSIFYSRGYLHSNPKTSLWRTLW